MRIKTLIKYNLSTMRNAILIYYVCYLGASLFASVINTLSGDDMVVFGVSGDMNGVPQTWSSAIIPFTVFMLVSSLIGAQKDTRFLITRSVARKEIFVANAAVMFPLAAIMGLLQIVGIYLDGFVRWCMGDGWRGLALDFQIGQAPDMHNPLVFFAVSVAILLTFGAVSYLLGSLIARWKTQTIIAGTILFILFITLAGSTNLLTKIVEVLIFMFLDDTTGLIIALKQIIIAAFILAVSFPIMRRITAAKQ